MYRQADYDEVPLRSESAMSHRRTSSNMPVNDHPLAHEPRLTSTRKSSPPSHAFSRYMRASPQVAYRESDLRRQEKEEARCLRDALQEMDLQEEARLHQAAQDEATELVWMHQNPGVPYKNPHAPYRNPDAPRRSQSPVRDSSVRKRVFGAFSSRDRRSTSSTSSSGGHHSPDGAGRAVTSSRGSSLADRETPSPPYGAQKKNLKVNFALPEEKPLASKGVDMGSKPRSVSNDSKGIFRNPNDQIYEEPRNPNEKESDHRPEFSRSDSSALRSKPRNSLPRVNKPLPWLRDRSSNDRPVQDKISRFDIHKNPPSQSRNPDYTKSKQLPPAPQEEAVPMKDGIEIRSNEIRTATSKKFKDRSENLPKPSAVSDRVGRAIVSFDPAWQPSDQPKPVRHSLGRVSPAPPPAPAAPTLEVSEATPVPVINVPDIKEPTVGEIPESSSKENNPGPRSKGSQNRQTFLKKQTSEPQDRWYSPYTRSGVPTVRCESCSLPISGKIVTAGGSRFHPECFTCFHCQTPLECVAFYQEPESSRNDRLANASKEDETLALRFYCHLDFHELFSPRCKSCKTPIEGEVVVACGAEWHVGHFFCAECGDPFNSQTPFVEKDGFAWCLQCHSRRTAPRCRGCKQNVMDEVVISAIGGQWHDRCFVCHECGQGFGPEGRFFVREGEPKRTAKGRIIGDPVQLAICEKCEGIRLKAAGMC